MLSSNSNSRDEEWDAGLRVVSNQLFNIYCNQVAQGHTAEQIAQRVQMDLKDFCRVLTGEVRSYRKFHRVAMAMDCRLEISVDGEKIGSAVLRATKK